VFEGQAVELIRNLKKVCAARFVPRALGGRSQFFGLLMKFGCPFRVLAHFSLYQLVGAMRILLTPILRNVACLNYSYQSGLWRCTLATRSHASAAFITLDLRGVASVVASLSTRQYVFGAEWRGLVQSKILGRQALATAIEKRDEAKARVTEAEAAVERIDQLVSAAEQRLLDANQAGRAARDQHAEAIAAAAKTGAPLPAIGASRAAIEEELAARDQLDATQKAAVIASKPLPQARHTLGQQSFGVLKAWLERDEFRPNR
jgi:hypothetical protein